MSFIEIGVLGLVIISFAGLLSKRVGVASPLILLALGGALASLPGAAAMEVDPEIIIHGVLPPLLFAAAWGMSVIDFRREIFPVAVLSILLVVFSSVVIGIVATLIIPQLSLAWGIALGAIVSPTDAVAVAIVRRTGVSDRIITLLEGEGLLNDATALVVLTTAISAATSPQSAPDAGKIVIDFLVTLIVAVVVGCAVGVATVHLRARINDTVIDTVFSFAVPFIAAIPAEHFGGSGLVAAVVAGLVSGNKGLRMFSAKARMNAHSNWATVEMVLEGAIFLMMGLQMPGIIRQLDEKELGMGFAAGVALFLGLVVVICRGLVVVPLLGALRGRQAQRENRVERNTLTAEVYESGLKAHVAGNSADFFAELGLDERVERRLRRSYGMYDRNIQRGRVRDEGTMRARFESRLERARADIDYFSSEPLGWREGIILIWAGMRGVVTLAAAQTLPADTPYRASIIFIAVILAAGSLALQGLTLNTVIGLVKPRMAGSVDRDECERLLEALNEASEEYVQNSGGSIFMGNARGDSASLSLDMSAQEMKEALEKALQIVDIQREALLEVRSQGIYSTATIEMAMERLDRKEVFFKGSLEGKKALLAAESAEKGGLRTERSFNSESDTSSVES